MSRPAPEMTEVSHHYAGVFLVTPSGMIIGQLRDDKPGIDNPGRVSAFGGTVEVGEDVPSAALRELSEETNLDVSRIKLEPYFETVAWRELTREWESQHFFYATLTEEKLQHLKIFEGQGWVEIASPDDNRLTAQSKLAIMRLREVLHNR